MSGTWRVANGVAAFNGRANFTGLLGKDDGPAIAEFAFGLIPTGTDKHNYHGVLDAGDAQCPTLSDFGAIGDKGVKGPIGVAARLDIVDMWATVLYQEPEAEEDVGVIQPGVVLVG